MVLVILSWQKGYVCTERLHNLSDVSVIDELALYFCRKYCDIVRKNISFLS